MSVKIFKGVPYAGTLPAVLTGTKAGYLHGYKIYGNLTQNGTPTPENPIYPSECGERTGNLFDKDSANIVGGYLDSTGAIVDSGGYYRTSDYIKILNSDSYVIYLLGRFTSSRRIMVAFYDESKTFLSFAQSRTFRNVEMSYAPEIPQNAVYIRFSYIGQNTPNTDVDVMLTEGSTAPSTYVPYGYKLPLLSGSTPVDIYIGDTPLGTDEYVDYGTQKIYKRTENLFDADSTHQGYYNNSGNFVANNKYICSQPIIVNEQNYTISAVNSYAGGGYIFQLVYFDANDEYISLDSASLYGAGKKSLTGSVPSSATKMIAVVTSDSSERMLVDGSSAPTSYIPYLQPTDPPVPFPQIPTSANSTTISWAGSGLAPSEFDSIAEWVSATPKIYTNGAWTDAQTYVYDDGTWVADN